MTKVKFCGIEFKNPVIGASGTFGFGRELSEYFDLSLLGGISTKGLTLEARPGNKGQRIYETPSGVMNSIGLQNPGVQGFIDSEWSFLENKNLVTLVNLGGGTVEDYVEGAILLEDIDAPIIELNISCPNVKEGGMAFGIQCTPAAIVVEAVRKVTTKKLVVKLSPNAENIKEMAYTCVEAGADGLSLVNTFNALAIDVKSRKPVFNNITAGLSGPAIKPIALRMVYEVATTVDVPIIGIGGIASAEDAIEFIMAGASLVQVGSANFRKPDICIDIVKGIEDYMTAEGIKDLEEIRGIIWR
ncbi:MAG: dihydroorotate dehydrogenase [Gudongella sp.]|nr:dihydroorotate dehydrogenase [Gudongella sp.]